MQLSFRSTQNASKTKWEAVSNRKTIGWIEAQITAPQADIIHIEISKKNRQQGAGTALLLHALTELKNAGINTIFLEVRQTNTPAIALYQSFGVTQISTRKNYYKNPTEDALVMEIK